MEIRPGVPDLLDRSTFETGRCLVESGMTIVALEDRGRAGDVAVGGRRLRLHSVFDAPAPRYVGPYKPTEPSRLLDGRQTVGGHGFADLGVQA